MKTRMMAVVLVGFAALLLQACVAFPPLIQVEHKESVSNQEIAKRLDAIDKRLGELEKNEQKARQK